MLADRLDGGRRILNDIMEQGGRDGDAVQVEFGADTGRAQRMMDELLTALAQAPVMLGPGELERPLYQLAVEVGVVAIDSLEEFLQGCFRGV